MKYVIRIALAVASVFLAKYLYDSIQEPILFEKERDRLYADAQDQLQLIKKAQMAFKENNKFYASNFNDLINHVDTADYIIVSKRDTAVIYYNDVYKEKQEKIITLVDTLGFVPIKDSLFTSKGYSLQDLAKVPNTSEVFTMKADTLKKGSVYLPVMEVSIAKEKLLNGLNPRYIKNKSQDLVLGSLTEIHLNGNW
jgi:hypothetical protein